MSKSVCPFCSTEYPAGVERCGRDGATLVVLEPTQVRAAPLAPAAPGAPPLRLPPEGAGGTEPEWVLTPEVRAVAVRGLASLPVTQEPEAATRPHVSFELPPDVKAALAASLAPGTFMTPALSREHAQAETRPSMPAADRTPVVDPLVGQTVGEYLVKGRLGEGGMGIVYEAVHPLIGKRVALKCLKREVASNPEEAVRLLSEARAANSIGHRGIIDIFGFGTLPDGRQYFAMELLNGEPLDFRIEQGPLDLGDALAILEDLLEPLAAAHTAGVVHRDLKPSNIFIVTPPTGHRYVKLLDFGLAVKLEMDGSRSLPGQLIGTPNYMAPEQVRGEPVTARTDLYAVGVIAWELVVGTPPFEGKSPWDTLKRHLHDEAPPLSSKVQNVPPELDALVSRLLSRAPADRPPTAEIVRAELKVLRRALQNNDTYHSLPGIGPLTRADPKPAPAPERRVPDTDPAGKAAPASEGTDPSARLPVTTSDGTDPAARLPVTTSEGTDPAAKGVARVEGTDEVPALVPSSAGDTQPRYDGALPLDGGAPPELLAVPPPADDDSGPTVRVASSLHPPVPSAPHPAPVPALGKESPSRVRRTAPHRDASVLVTHAGAPPGIPITTQVSGPPGLPNTTQVTISPVAPQPITRVTRRPEGPRRWPWVLAVMVLLGLAAAVGWSLG